MGKAIVRWKQCFKFLIIIRQYFSVLNWLYVSSSYYKMCITLFLLLFQLRAWIESNKALLGFATNNLSCGLTFLGFNFISCKMSGLDSMIERGHPKLWFLSFTQDIFIEHCAGSWLYNIVQNKYGPTILESRVQKERQTSSKHINKCIITFHSFGQ